MSESIRSISTRTVAFWKSKGFSFVPAPDMVDCTDVMFGGKPFHYFLVRRVPTSADLLRELNIEVSPAAIRLHVAGEYGDDDLFPWYLLTQEGLALMEQARQKHIAALNAAAEAAVEFCDVLYLRRAD